MFLPEELITYAVYSNPADFCQGRKLLKDGFALSFTGRAGWFDRLTSKVGEAWPEWVQGPWTGVSGVSCKCQQLRMGERKEKPGTLTATRAYLPWQCQSSFSVVQCGQPHSAGDDVGVHPGCGNETPLPALKLGVKDQEARSIGSIAG